MATVIPQIQLGDLVRQRSTPDILGAVGSGLNLASTFGDQRRARDQEKALIGHQQLGEQVATSLLSGQANPQAMARLLAQNPDMAAGILKQAGIVGQRGRDQLARTAFEIESIPAGPQRDAKIQEIGAQLQSQGVDPSLALGLIGLSPDQQNKKLQSMQLAAMSAEDRQGIAEGTRSFDLQERQFRLNQANIASQIGARSLTAGQKSEEFDIKRETLAIRRLEQEQRALDRQVVQETNKLKRDQLQIKIDEKKAEIVQKKLDTQFTVDSSIASIDDTILTTERLLEGEGLEKAAGVSEFFFTTPGSDAANFEAVLETFKSQQFIQEVDKMRGLGALGEKEGQRLIDSAGSLSLTMSDKELRREINRLQSKLVQARLRIKKKFSISPSDNIGSSSISNRIKKATTKKERDIILQSLTGDDISNMSPAELEILLGQ